MKLPQKSLEGNHLPVMIEEVTKLCNPKNGGNFMDCTFGAGGYSKALLKFKDAKIIALDRDDRVNEIANKLKNTGNWKLIPKAKINFITKDKYSLTFASNWIGKFVDKPELSNDKKNLIARGMIR